jgi:hypothetical protein
MRNKTHTNIQTYNRKAGDGGVGCTFLIGNVSTYLNQSVYFIRSVQGKHSGKNQALTILDAR